MRKLSLLLLLLLAVAAYGCRGNSATPASPDGEAASTQPATVPAPLPTATWAAATQEVAQVSAPPGCTVISPEPTPGATENSIFPPVTDDDWQFGPRDAAITFVEYGDFQ